ncbi:alpha/beta hydrolase [Chlorobaculum sp. 24CR]|uniref:alpha/beta hydrolase n=1 Tax=Chlorobaculum sp. 24CR TaxID=2508878 RepID=UPI00100A85F8|nr:alpha/beta hydrolase [Chlorobaculum sp. 24CR]RXK88480.1 alpha/beta hydrolase [Chlorobaculum sp. 24CR]
MSSQQGAAARENEWLGYYDRFGYFSPEAVRDGCQPRIMEHPEPPKKAIVLVHGLSDSPWFMTAIGDYFFKRLGYNVYMPLLHCHGLKEPNGMEGVELEEWKSNVSFAVNTAASKAGEVSIGGLSTGGALGLYMAAINPKIRGALYLFSAALDLAGGPFGLFGELKEKLLLTFLADLLDFNSPLIGDNPYRYSFVDMDGAAQLARLIKETDTIIDLFDQRFPFPGKVFAAHSKCDTTADIAGIEALQKVSVPERFKRFDIDEDPGVPHASVVLEQPIVGNDGKELEPRNPVFPEMMQAIAAFETIG